ncbi:hypothetical protein HIM_07046 [Hirsutella minnesotensis 3608]|uniref:Mid2 domain-containing protein n=1 Tax=Hirsutella minnesotensis 3608 TaxID=1043627 RepID=A0A0F7ZNC1_9HYPO|nr:hypothetical protein HIM_07046 [Hirsutella minnesotensis 3608]
MPRLRAALTVLTVHVFASNAFGSDPSWKQPRETIVSDLALEQLRLGYSPRPTSPPRLHGSMERRGLFPRLDGALDPATCGFTVANNGKAVAWTCRGDTAVCKTIDDSMICCEPDASCSKWSACLGYTAVAAGECGSTLGSLTFCCSAARPECFTWYKTPSTSGLAGQTTLTLMGCHFSSGLGTLLDYDPREVRTQSSSDTTVTDTTTTGTDATATGMTTGTGTTEAGTTTTGTGGQRAEDGRIEQSPSNAGAIAGGVVGGVVGLALVAVLAFFLLRRQKTGREPSSKHSPADSSVHPLQASPPIHYAYPSSAQYYDDHTGQGAHGPPAHHHLQPGVYTDRSATTGSPPNDARHQSWAEESRLSAYRTSPASGDYGRQPPGDLGHAGPQGHEHTYAELEGGRLPA